MYNEFVCNQTPFFAYELKEHGLLKRRFFQKSLICIYFFTKVLKGKEKVIVFVQTSNEIIWQVATSVNFVTPFLFAC